MYSANAGHTQMASHPHRSWTDDHDHQPRNSASYAPRSSSFSASRPPPPPKWKEDPPPPVPPLPPSLFPGFHGPSLTHSSRDYFFAEPTKPPAAGHVPWTHPAPNSSHSITPPSLDPLPSSASWPSFAPSAHSGPSSNSGSGPPVVPPRPAYPNGYIPDALTPGAKRFLYYTSDPYLSFSNYPPSPPPVVPPRPETAHGDMRFSQSTPLENAPALPPKTKQSLIASDVPFPSSTVIPSPPTKDWHPSSSSDTYQHLEVKNVPSMHFRTQSTDDLDRALAMSLTESQAKQAFGGKTQDEEDTELACALAESLRMGGKSDGQLTKALSAPDSGGSAISLAQKVAREEAEARRVRQEREDQEATKKLIEEEKRQFAAEKREREKRDEEMARRQAEEEERIRREERETQERKDAEMARSLAAANNPRPVPVTGLVSTPAPTPDPVPIPAPAPMVAPVPIPVRVPMPAPDPALTQVQAPAGRRPEHEAAPGLPELPQYDDVVASPPPRAYLRPGTTPGTVRSAPLPDVSSPQPTPGRAASALATSPVHPKGRPEFARSSTLGGGVAAQPNGKIQLNGYNDSRGPSPPNPPPPGGAPGASRASTIPASRETSVEPDLLRGVSFEFKPPKLPSAPPQSESEWPSSPPFPDVIRLYHAPSPPLHIMAPSWRHLMRLLAQLETRIEASVDAIARSKEEQHLRVVVQFVKLPYTANSWRTVLYLSLDHVIPRNTPNAWIFTNGDTTVLPYSYTLGEPPAHLATTPLSQIYVIPLSATSPFPILPIALPNVALYLQSAMRDSRARKVQNDPSNGMRRLARMVGMCYPEEVANTEESERESGRGMGGLFKRVVGRKKREDTTQGNEDVYDIITPFRIDQYTSI